MPVSHAGGKTLLFAQMKAFNLNKGRLQCLLFATVYTEMKTAARLRSRWIEVSKRIFSVVIVDETSRSDDPFQIRDPRRLHSEVFQSICKVKQDVAPERLGFTVFDVKIGHRSVETFALIKQISNRKF